MRMTNSSQFAQNFPDFSCECTTSLEIPQFQASRDSWSPKYNLEYKQKTFIKLYLY